MPESKSQAFPQATTEALDNPGHGPQLFGTSWQSPSPNFRIPDGDSFDNASYIEDGIGLRQKLLALTVLPSDSDRCNGYYGTAFNLSYDIPQITEPLRYAAKHNMYAPNLLPPTEEGTSFTALTDNPVKVPTFRLGKNNLENTPDEYKWPFGPLPYDTSSEVKSRSNNSLPPVEAATVRD